MLGRVWSGVLCLAVDPADEGERAASEITLANGKTIVLTNTKVITKLSNNSVAAASIRPSSRRAGRPTGRKARWLWFVWFRFGFVESSGGSGAGSASGGGSSSGGSTDGGAGGDTGSGGLSAAEEESIHSWLVAKYNMLDDYVARANSVVSTYNATGDTRPCDSLVSDMFVIRAEFGRQTFSPESKWYQQYANLWGCYTNLCQWVGHYGDDDVALNNFNTKVAAIAL